MSTTSWKSIGRSPRVRARERIIFLLGVLLGILVGIAVYAALRGDLIPEHPAFEHAAETGAPESVAVPDG